MNIKIFSRSLFIKNTMIFVGMSYLFVFFIENFNHPQIFNNFTLLQMYMVNNPLLGLTTVVLIISIFYVSSTSRFLFLLFSLGIFVYSIKVYFLEDTPAILPLSLVYMMCSYYFYSLFCEEVKGAVYVPKFNQGDLNPVKNKKLIANLTFREKDHSGYLLNWDKGNIFLLVPDGQKLRGKVGITMELFNSKFFFEGNVVTSYNKGYGLRISEKTKTGLLNWANLYDVLIDRGY